MLHYSIYLIFFYIKGLGTRNLNPTTGVNTPVKTTQYITSRDSTTGETECINNVKINWNVLVLFMSDSILRM